MEQQQQQFLPDKFSVIHPQQSSSAATSQQHPDHLHVQPGIPHLPSLSSYSSSPYAFPYHSLHQNLQPPTQQTPFSPHPQPQLHNQQIQPGNSTGTSFGLGVQTGSHSALGQNFTAGNIPITENLIHTLSPQAKRIATSGQLNLKRFLSSGNINNGKAKFSPIRDEFGRKLKLRHYCAVRSCPVTEHSRKPDTRQKYRFYRIPPRERDPARREIWLRALRPDNPFWDSKWGRVCERHFPDGNPGKTGIPSLFLDPENPGDLDPHGAGPSTTTSSTSVITTNITKSLTTPRPNTNRRKITAPQLQQSAVESSLSKISPNSNGRKQLLSTISPSGATSSQEGFHSAAGALYPSEFNQSMYLGAFGMGGGSGNRSLCDSSGVRPRDLGLAVQLAIKTEEVGQSEQGFGSPEEPSPEAVSSPPGFCTIHDDSHLTYLVNRIENFRATVAQLQEQLDWDECELRRICPDHPILFEKLTQSSSCGIKREATVSTFAEEGGSGGGGGYRSSGLVGGGHCMVAKRRKLLPALKPVHGIIRNREREETVENQESNLHNDTPADSVVVEQQRQPEEVTLMEQEPRDTVVDEKKNDSE